MIAKSLFGGAFNDISMANKDIYYALEIKDNKIVLKSECYLIFDVQVIDDNVTVAAIDGVKVLFLGYNKPVIMSNGDNVDKTRHGVAVRVFNGEDTIFLNSRGKISYIKNAVGKVFSDSANIIFISSRYDGIIGKIIAWLVVVISSIPMLTYRFIKYTYITWLLLIQLRITKDDTARINRAENTMGEEQTGRVY